MISVDFIPIIKIFPEKLDLNNPEKLDLNFLEKI